MNAIIRYIGMGCMVCLPLYLFKRIINCCCGSKNRDDARVKKDDDSYLDLPKQKTIFDRTAVPTDPASYYVFISNLKEAILTSDLTHISKETEENLKVLIKQCDNASAKHALETIINKSATSISLTKVLVIQLTDYVKQLNGSTFKSSESLLHSWYLEKVINNYGKLVQENTGELDLLISCLIEKLQQTLTTSTNTIMVAFAGDLTYSSLGMFSAYLSQIKQPNTEVINKIKNIVGPIEADLKDFGEVKLGKQCYSILYHVKEINEKLK